jgi:hypothetical protein
MKTRNNNFKGLLQLCEEFHFRDLSVQFSQFRDSGGFHEDAVVLSVLEERVQQHDREIKVLHAAVAGARIVRAGIRTEAESASRRANDIEAYVGEVQSEAENLRNAFREVRTLQVPDNLLVTKCDLSADDPGLRWFPTI